MITLMGKYISILHRQEQKYLGRVLQTDALGISGVNFLLYLARNEGVSQKRLCETLAIDEALGTRSLKKLAEEGFLERKRDEADLRSYALFLTPKGKKLVPEIRHAIESWWSEMMQRLPFDEAETLRLMAQLEQMANAALQINHQKEQKKERTSPYASSHQ